MERMLSDAPLVGRIGLQPETVRTLWKSFIAGNRGLYWSRVWSIYALLSWCQKHDVAMAA
jgi:asparagine synthase (glutamine-hydrolysing)